MPVFYFQSNVSKKFKTCDDELKGIALFLIFLVLALILGHKFEFCIFLLILHYFYPRLWPYPQMEFDEILSCYRVYSLLHACRKPMYLADFQGSNQLIILIFTDFCPVLWYYRKPLFLLVFEEKNIFLPNQKMFRKSGKCLNFLGT